MKQSNQTRGYPEEYAGEREFPYLWALMGGTFHQDFDINGNTLEEIIGSFRSDTTPDVWLQTRSEIERFLAERLNDRQMVEDFERMFVPQVITEGWEGLTTRQFLLKIADLLK